MLMDRGLLFASRKMKNYWRSINFYTWFMCWITFIRVTIYYYWIRRLKKIIVKKTHTFLEAFLRNKWNERTREVIFCVSTVVFIILFH